MSGAPPPQPGTAGTDDDPLDIETDVLELLNNATGVATVENLIGVAADSTSTDGTLVYPTANGAQGVPTDLVVRIDGVDRPVTAIEYSDSTGTLRPVTEWHLGPLGAFELTLDSLTFVQPATFDVTIASTTSPAAPGNTLDVTVDVTNTGDETGTQTVTLDIGGVGQVDSQGVPLTGGQSSTTTLSWSVPSSQTEQDYQATVSSADDTASQTVTVASATVPSSAIHRWKLDDVATGTATDSIGSADGTVNGVSNVSGTYQGGSAGDGDGTDDFIDVGTLGSFGSGLNSGGAIGLTVKFTDTSNFISPLGSSGADDFEGVTIFSNSFASSNGRLELQLRDDTGDDAVVTTTTGVADGNKHRVLFNINDPSANDVDVHTDAVAGTNTIRGDGPTMGDLTETMLLFARNRDTGEDSYWPGVVDDVILYDSALSSSEIQDDYNIQPWS